MKKKNLKNYGEQKISETQYNKYIYRYISNMIVDKIKNTSLTPNQITSFSLICAIIAALFFSFGNYIMSLLGALFVQSSILLDFVDGGLAKVKKMSSLLGRWYDSQVDRLTDVIIFFGISIGLFISGNQSAWFLGFLAVSSRMLIAFLQYAIRLIVPDGLKIIDEGIKKNNLIKILVYGRINIHLILLVSALFNILNVGVFLISLYGYSFYFFSLFFFSKKIKKLKSKK